MLCFDLGSRRRKGGSETTMSWAPSMVRVWRRQGRYYDTPSRKMSAEQGMGIPDTRIGMKVLKVIVKI
jgi:hypothetical protein